jgi:TPR repeat protein
MRTVWIDGGPASGGSASRSAAADLLIAEWLDAAANGDVTACFDLGVACSTGVRGFSLDLIEAHKWFNLAAVGGFEQAKACRADISEEMTAREIAEAQRRAREWLAASRRMAA